MGIKEQRELAREKSFVYKLTKADITKFLQKLGLNLAYLYDDYGNAIPPIRREYDKEKKEYVLTINYSKKPSTTEKHVQEAVQSKFYPLFKDLLNGYIGNMTTGALILTDYRIFNFGALCKDVQNYQKEYAYFMYAKFGDYYKKKYNAVVRKDIKEARKSQEESEKQ